jgi:hypothetical protein
MDRPLLPNAIFAREGFPVLWNLYSELERGESPFPTLSAPGHLGFSADFNGKQPIGQIFGQSPKTEKKLSLVILEQQCLCVS